MPTIKEMMAKSDEVLRRIDADEAMCKLFHEKIFKYVDHPLVSKVVDIVGTQEKYVKNMSEMFSEVVSKNILDHWQKQVRPFIILDPNKLDHIRVYPNIIVDAVPFEKLTNIKLTSVSSLFSNMIQAYDKDMSGEIPNAYKKWENEERVIKRLSEFHSYPTAQVLTNHLNMKDTYKDDQIRDLALKIDTVRKPMELIFADKPEDFIIMYSENGGIHSCMSHKNGWDFMKKSGNTATSFYAYFPYTRGAYLMKNAKVVARVILYTDPKQDITDMGYPNFNKSKAEKWYYGVPYTTNPEAHKELMKALSSRGYEPISNTPGQDRGNHFLVPNSLEMIIPGIPHQSNYISPFPYFDNMDYTGTGFSCTFDTETKNFSFTYKKGNTGNIPQHHQSGYISSLDYMSKKCMHCDITKSTKWIGTYDGDLYCSYSCAQLHGYTQVYQGHPEPIYTKIKDISKFVISVDGKVFTNGPAANTHNYYLPMTDEGALCEDTAEYKPLGGNFRDIWQGRDGRCYGKPEC